MDAVYEIDVQNALDNLAIEQSNINIELICEQIKSLQKQIDELDEIWATEGASSLKKQINKTINKLKIDELYNMVELIQSKQVTYDFTSMDA